MERSESGAPIYRHEAQERDFEAAIGDAEHIERISDHIEEHIGPIASVLHELVSDQVHIDIHVVAPTPERDFYTLVTSGMSERAMAAPEQCADFRY
ncbi:MAG: suppressor of fused domain protein, partial [Acidobacteriota bacterium]